MSDVVAVDAVRADGGLVRIRPVVRQDADGLHTLFAQASDRSIYLRFFSVSRESADDYLPRLLAAPGPQHRALVACIAERIVGVAAYERLEDDAAEVSLLVADDCQHAGIGTLLIEHLASVARHDGVERFVAEMLTENSAMIEVLRNLGYHSETRLESGTVRIVFSLHPGERVLAAIDERERAADVASLRPLLTPRTIAVVGASTRPEAVGHQVLRNIITGGFTGAVYAVNPNHSSVLSMPTYPSVEALPVEPDLAIIAVPASQVPSVLLACGERGAHGIVLLTAGFGETGTEGSAAQNEVLQIVRQFGMRLIGPNCLGLLNTDPTVRLNATFASLPMQDGHVGLVSQSGALGIAVLNAAARSGLGISQFVSVGNKADVSGNDLLMAWEQDDRTRVIALYLDSFGNPRKFARIARRVAQCKPVIAIKAGRSSAGQRAGASHTAAAAVSDVVVDALFSQAGVLRVSTMEQMLDTARVLCGQPLPAGPHVAIIGNSGGPGILAADAAEGAGLTVVTLNEETRERLRQLLPSAPSLQNPVDLGAAVRPDQLGEAVRAVLEADEVDAVLTAFTDTAVSDPGGAMASVAAASAGSAKPVVATRVGAATGSVPVTGSERAVPVFMFPEPAVTALAFAYKYSLIKADVPAAASHPADVDVSGAREIVAEALVGGTEWLDADTVAGLLMRYGIPQCPQRVVDNADSASKAAAEMGYPLAVKLASGGVHKTELGGVRLGVADEAELRRVVAELQTIQPTDGRVLLQPMVGAGTEVIIGAVQHDRFGPVVMVGAGGVLADFIADRVFRLAPLAAEDAQKMIGELRISRLLNGYRGQPGVSRAALGDVLIRVAALVHDLPEIAELDLNPVICRGDDLMVVDARIRVAPRATQPDPLLRRLR